MQSLERRICVLERFAPEIDDEPMFINLVAMGAVGVEIQCVEKGSQAWHRLTGESEQELKDRAVHETEPLPNGCKLVFLCH
jgi:hypothetical protein